MKKFSNQSIALDWTVKPSQQEFQEEHGFCEALFVLKDGTLVSGESTIKLWEPTQGKCLKTLKGHKYRVYALAELPGGILASGGLSDKSIKLWDIARGKELKKLTDHKKDINALAVLSNGILASGSSDDTIKLWDIKKGKCIKTLKGHANSVNALAVLPDGILASAGFDTMIKLWDTNNGECVQTLDGHTGSIKHLAILADGNLVSGDSNGIIKLWDIQQRSCVHTFTAHSHYVDSLVVLADGTLVSCSYLDKTVKFWDTQQGQCIKTINTDPKSLAVLADGHTLACGIYPSITLYAFSPKALQPSNKFEPTDLHMPNPCSAAIKNQFENIKCKTENEGGSKEDVNIRMDYGRTKLHNAVYGHTLTALAVNCDHAPANENADINQSYELLEKDAVNDTASIANKIRANITQAVESIAKLIKDGADINAKDFEGKTPLHDAISSGHIEFVEILLKNGADIDARDKNGFSSLHEAVLRGHIQLAELLLKQGAAVDAQDNAGSTPLHQAAAKGYTQLVELLLRSGADINMQNNIGWTSLHWVALYGHVELAQLLLKNNAEVNARNKFGWTPLHYAASSGSHEVFKLFLDNGADVNTQTTAGWTSSHEAIFNANISIIKILLEKRVDWNIKDNTNKTALYYLKSKDQIFIGQFLIAATKENNIEIVRVLLKQAKDINNVNSKGWSALHYAAFKGYIEVAKLLLQNHADISLKTDKGNTAYDFAVEKNQVEIIKLLAPSEQQHQLTSDKLSSGKQKVDKPTTSPAEKPVPTSPQLDISFHIPYSQLIFEKELGKGGFGIVFKGTWRFNDVAIKQLHLTQPTLNALEEFQHEMHIMAKLRSPHIVQLYGVCAQQTPYCIVMEYMPKGSLYQVLHSNTELSWSTREQIATDIACGLAFLHEEKIVHRDLKSLNVLLDQQFKAKLSDFGLSRIKTETASTTKNDSVGTLAWMAPELFKRRAVYTSKSDMYSYGMTIWELAARDIPFKDASNPILIQNWVTQGEREEVPKETPPKLAKLIKFCWEADPEKRPSAEQAVKELKTQATDSINSQPVYRDNFNSTVHSSYQNQSKGDENSGGYRSNFNSFKP